MTGVRIDGLRGLRGRLYGLSFVDEFGPVYAVYTLWFNDNGITAAGVSTVFLVWAVVALVLEVPSGALADRVDRRRLLAVAFVIRAVGISLWLIWPTFTGVLIGAVLWAIHDSLASGSWEAMIHDQLSARGLATRYGTVMARTGQFSNLGIAAGTVTGLILLRGDVSLVTLGWITVAAHAFSIGLVSALPRTAVVPLDDDEADPAGDRSAVGRWWATLVSGLDDVRSQPVVARLLVLGAVGEGLFLVDEYLPLVARARGGSEAAATVLVLVVWLGLLAGGELAARRPDLGARPLGLGLIAGVAAMAVALVSGSLWALAVVAGGYAVLEAARVVADARLQERADDAVRATVSSFRGLGAAGTSMAVFVAVGLLSDGDDPTPGLYLLLTALVGLGLLVIRWLPPAPSSLRRPVR